MSPPPSVRGARWRDPEPSEPHGPGPRVKTCSSSCLSWLHPLRSWSLRQTRGGSNLKVASGNHSYWTYATKDNFTQGLCAQGSKPSVAPAFCEATSFSVVRLDARLSCLGSGISNCKIVGHDCVNDHAFRAPKNSNDRGHCQDQNAPSPRLHGAPHGRLQDLLAALTKCLGLGPN